MEKKIYNSEAVRSSLLLISLIFSVFILPILPGIWQKTMFRFFYTFIYLAAIMSLEKRSKYLFYLLAGTILTEWISGILNLPVPLAVAKLVNILFFFVIVILLISQIASSKKVSAGIIIDSISGYLLLGVIFSIFLMFIIQYDPQAISYNQSQTYPADNYQDKSIPIYFSFVTLATLGYGDIVPLEPYTRSLATLIAVTGQFYIAVIVALLVGKFSAQKFTSGDD
jgi:hypothetical protein